MNTKLKNILENFSKHEITEDFISLLVANEMGILPHHGCEFGANHDPGYPVNDGIRYFIPSRRIEEFEFYRQHCIIFGQATHSGSKYAIYKAMGKKNLNEYPILVLGDEGGALILANGLYTFLQFLTFNHQPYINIINKPYFFDFRGETKEESDNREFRAWAKTKFNIDPINMESIPISSIIQPAQEKHQKAIDDLFDNYL